MNPLYWVLAFTACMPVASAYVAPSFHITRMIARKHTALNEGSFQHKITFYKSNGKTLGSFSETLQFLNTETAVVKLYDESGSEVASQTRKLSNSADGLRPVSYDLLFLKSEAMVSQGFKGWGLPVKSEEELYSEKDENPSLPYKPESSVSLARFENRTALLLSNATKTSQLWVEKDSYLPLKALFTAPAAFELRFSGYQVFKNMLYPRTTQVFRDNQLWAKIDVQSVHIGEKPAAHASKSKADLDSDAQEAVSIYFKWIR